MTLVSRSLKIIGSLCNRCNIVSIILAWILPYTILTSIVIGNVSTRIRDNLFRTTSRRIDKYSCINRANKPTCKVIIIVGYFLPRHILRVHIYVGIMDPGMLMRTIDSYPFCSLGHPMSGRFSKIPNNVRTKLYESGCLFRAEINFFNLSYTYICIPSPRERRSRYI